MSKENQTENLSVNERPILEQVLEVYDYICDNPQGMLDSKIPEIKSAINPLLPCLKSYKDKLPEEMIIGNNMAIVQKDSPRSFRIYPRNEENISIDLYKEKAEDIVTTGTHIGIIIRNENRGNMTIALENLWNSMRLYVGFMDGKKGQHLTLTKKKPLLGKESDWKTDKFQSAP
ncbi:hypothetical protein ACFL15_00570 [Patescibacteria group bacterium]